SEHLVFFFLVNVFLLHCGPRVLCPHRVCVLQSVDAAIGGSTYQHSRVNQWSSSVVENCLGQLTKLGKPFKYIVTCIIMQKNGAGLQTATSCFWDNTTDGSCTVRWENKSMYCIVSVFGLAI
uniref:Dynein light chain Tctex-type 1 n=1 Tax=Scleropages formosus TaxID=113540 RepID=A0A8C9TLY9_SCLFO